MLLTRDPFSSATGRGLVLKTVISSLENLGIKITIVCFEKVKGGADKRVIELKGPGVASLIKAVTLSLWKKLPLNELLYFEKNRLQELSKLVDEERPDFVYADMIRMAKYADCLGLPTIFDMDDVLSERYRKAVDNNQNTNFGYLSKKLPKWVNHVFGAVNIFVLKRESKCLAVREVYYAKKFQCTSLVSAYEARLFNNKHGTEIEPLPMAIKVGRRLTPKNDSLPSALFVGTLDYEPNKQAVLFLAKEVLPLIRDKAGFENFTLNVVGKLPAEPIMLENEGLCFEGYVEDLSVCYAENTVVLAPSFLPGGVKTKVIEALAYGRPVIANNNSIEGLDDVRHIVGVAESPTEWVDAIVELHGNYDEHLSRANAGVEYVQSRFGEDSVRMRWKRVVDLLMANPQIMTLN